MATELQKILKLTAKALRTGEARSQYDDTEGVWQQAIGLNPFLEDSSSRFLCAVTAAPTRIGASDFTDIPISHAQTTSASNPALAVLGSGGRFYTVNNDNTYAVVRPGASTLAAISNPTGGMAPVTDSGGNSYVFVCSRTALIRWDQNTADSTAHWNESNSLNTSNHHPMHRVFLNTYFGNGQYLGSIPHDQLHNQATTLTNVNFQLINFGADQIVTAIGDDGRYTLVGTSSQFDSTTNGKADARIVWYPNIGINWDWEVTLKGERCVLHIVRNAYGTFAIGEQTIYQLFFGAQPKLIKTFDTTDSPGSAFTAISTGVGPRANIVAPFGDSFIFGKRGAVFGKRFPSEPNTFSHPLQGHTSTISMIAPNFVTNKVFVGTEDSKFWVYDMTAAGNTPNSFVTRWFDLEKSCTISRLEMELPAGVAASDVMGITVEVPSGDTAAVTISQAELSAKRRTNPQILLKPTLLGSQVRFTFTPSAGAPKFGSLFLYGTPTEE